MAKLNYKNGVTSVILRVKLLDSTSTTGAGKTALDHTAAGLIISTIADTESSATAYTAAGSTIEAVTTNGTFAAPTATKCRFKKIDDTNHPGIYEIQIADARWAVSNAKSIIVTVQATGVVPVDAEIQLEYVPADILRINSDADNKDYLVDMVTAGWDNANNWLRVNVVAISGDSTAADNEEAFFDGTGYAGTNNVIPTVTAIAANGISSASFAADTGMQSIRSNTAQSGTSSTITLDASASSTTDFYKGRWIRLTGGTGSGQVRLITAYNGTTKAATVATWATSPDNTTTFAILNAANIELVTTVTTVTTASTVTTVNGLAAGVITAASIASDAITDAKVASDVTIASVTGAVGSVTGNVGGNVTGSVGSVAAGGITASSIATGAIDADALAADAGTELADAILSRNVSNVEGSAGEHTLCTVVLAMLENSISGTTLTIKRTDGSTTHYTKTLSVDAAADPITGIQ